jgi:hypothetical protein
VARRTFILASELQGTSLLHAGSCALARAAVDADQKIERIGADAHGTRDAFVTQAQHEPK